MLTIFGVALLGTQYPSHIYCNAANCEERNFDAFETQASSKARTRGWEFLNCDEKARRGEGENKGREGGAGGGDGGAGGGKIGEGGKDSDFFKFLILFLIHRKKYIKLSI